MERDRSVGLMGVEVEYGVFALGAGSNVDSLRLGEEVVSCHLEAVEQFGVRSVGTAYDGMLTNGARLYCDMGHPEYSTPECSNLEDLIAAENAGDQIISACLEARSAQDRGVGQLVILKNNTNYRGVSWGCHENYLVSPWLFDQLTAKSGPELWGGLAPFLVSRQLIAGSGRVGGEGGWTGYQLSQRADFINTLNGLDTTRNRSIVNTRNEPLANRDRFRRLHLVLGDSNMSDLSKFLKLGSTRWILRLLEQGALPFNLALRDPVGCVQAISRDPWSKVELLSGRKVDAWEMQMEFLDAAQTFLEKTYSVNGYVDQEELRVLELWGETLEALKNNLPWVMSRLDWAIKLAVLEEARSNSGLEWSDTYLRELDLRYHDLSLERSIYRELVRGGFVEELMGMSTMVSKRLKTPPGDTRAGLRGEALAKLVNIGNADWESLEHDGQILRWPDPTRGA